jgi:quercetin dioxygenase-like cupin family protein
MHAMNLTKPDRSQAQPTPSPEYFDGAVHMQHLVSKEESQEVELIAVFFQNGARTIPHVHTTDQVLIVVEGTCVVGDRAGRRELTTGEVAFLPGNQWHWHGAKPGVSACHISIRKPGPTDWSVPKYDW